MKLSLVSLIIALLIFADACTRGAPPDEPVPLETAATCANFLKGKTQMNLKQVITCLPLICAANPTSCIPIGPVAGTGGAAPFATGGTSSVGGGVATGGSGALTPCQQACANLARLGCPEDQATCPAQCELNSKDARFTLNVQCRINATTKTQAQACGIASCR